MKIKNFNDLAVNKLRRDALLIAEAGLEAIDTRRIILNNKIIKNLPHERIIVVAIGKCALDAAEVLEEIFRDKIKAGICLDIRKGNLKYIKSLEGDHPLSSERNIKAGKEIIKLIKKSDKKDLFLFVISGGGSALLSDQINEREILRVLFKAGANIQEINTIRKHTSGLRGGWLAKYAYPAEVMALIFSDVPGDDLQFIASGPTVKDKTTLEDAREILKKYGIKAELKATPQPAKYFVKVDNLIVASNKIALQAMRKKAKLLGYNLRIKDFKLSGRAKEIGREIVKRPGLYGGESAVEVLGKGKGGRNQELALSALENIQIGQVVLALASDGWDNSRHAGAICDIITKKKCPYYKNYLRQNNSFLYFKKTGDAIITGPTGSNVADLIIVLHERQR